MLRLLTFIFALMAVTGAINASEQESTCPKAWFDIKLPEGSKTCRVFGVKKPATLSFFVVAQPEFVSNTLAKQFNNAQTAVQGRYLTIQSADQQYRAYIFKDGAGTQVNLMLN